ncbi:MAG: hypothetical protein GWN00_27735, partial [Aliifodinibius sp.]|nr:hypothetical protein [Fodinibius sp.]NIY28459.1 hypothetical protein [Fodinibius sp.]
EAESDTEAEPEEPEFIPSIIESIVDEPEPAEKPSKKKLNVYFEEDEPELEYPSEPKKRSRSKGRTLEYDEDLG